jgi:hypothetical protein
MPGMTAGFHECRLRPFAGNRDLGGLKTLGRLEMEIEVTHGTTSSSMRVQARAHRLNAA